MIGIVLRTQAIKVVTLPSHFRYFNKYELEKDPATGIAKKIKKRMEQKIPARDGVVWECQKCGKRSTSDILKNIGIVRDGVLAFECPKCKAVHEVSKPRPEQEIIHVPGMEKPKHFGLVDPSGRPISTEW